MPCVAQSGADRPAESPTPSDFLQHAFSDQLLEQQHDACTPQLSQHRRSSPDACAKEQNTHDCSTAEASSGQQDQLEASWDLHAQPPTESCPGTSALPEIIPPEAQDTPAPPEPSHSAQHAASALSAVEAHAAVVDPVSTGTSDLAWDLDTGGGQVDEEVLNALPPELKHEVRLAIMSRLGRHQGTSADSNGATLFACGTQRRGHQEIKQDFAAHVPEGGSRHAKIQANTTQHAGTGKGRARSKRSAAPISHFFQKQKQ